MKKIIKCDCGEVGTIVVELFHSGYLVVDGDTVNVRESEDTPEADAVARCCVCGKEYPASEWENLIKLGKD